MALAAAAVVAAVIIEVTASVPAPVPRPAAAFPEEDVLSWAKRDWSSLMWGALDVVDVVVVLLDGERAGGGGGGAADAVFVRLSLLLVGVMPRPGTEIPAAPRRFMADWFR